jgi:Cdc6-like AAA superfamily ATPase
MVVRVDPVAIAATSVFVGRQSELRALHDAFGQASGGHSQLLLVEGEAGIGKTTLVERFVSELQATRVLRASGDEAESHVPFATADQLLRNDGRGSDALSARRHVAIGLELLELISSGRENEPCVVVIDDAHLIDAESLRALLFAARRLLASRVLVVLVVRGTTDDTLAACYGVATVHRTSGARPMRRSSVTRVAPMSSASAT